MPFAHRMSAKKSTAVRERIYNDLLNSSNQLLLIRLHILGDFFNVKYVKLRKMLNTFNNIAYMDIQPTILIHLFHYQEQLQKR